MISQISMEMGAAMAVAAWAAVVAAYLVDDWIVRGGVPLESPRVPAKAQRSGFGGRRRSRGMDEQSSGKRAIANDMERATTCR